MSTLPVSQSFTSPDSKPFRNHSTERPPSPASDCSGSAPEAIVADGGRSREPFLDVALLEHPCARTGVGPHAGEAVSLKLEPNEVQVRIPRVALCFCRTSPFRSRAPSHVVPDLCAITHAHHESPGAPNRRDSSWANERSR